MMREQECIFLFKFLHVFSPWQKVYFLYLLRKGGQSICANRFFKSERKLMHSKGECSSMGKASTS